MTHLMLDLETWGKKPGYDLRSIGATMLDPYTGTVCLDAETYYVATDNPVQVGGYYDGISEFRKYPLTRDPETVKWWADQGEEAQAAFANPVDLHTALCDFSAWFLSFDMDPKKIRLWANDPHFDVSILQGAFDAVGLEVPWHYRAPRSMKTVTELAGMESADFIDYGVPHHALDDAIAQSMTVCVAYRRLGLQT